MDDNWETCNGRKLQVFWSTWAASGGADDDVGVGVEDQKKSVPRKDRENVAQSPNCSEISTVFRLDRAWGYDLRCSWLSITKKERKGCLSDDFFDAMVVHRHLSAQIIQTERSRFATK